MKRRLLFLATTLLIATPALAEDLNAIFEKVNKYVSEENYSKAIEELGWAKKEIETLHMTKLQTLLPEAIGEFKGEPAQSQSALGFTSVEKLYKKGDQQLKLAITGSGSQAAGGGLAALGRMAAMMGGTAPGMDTFRVDGRTAHVQMQQAAKRAEVSIFLDSGSIIKLEMSKASDTKEIKALAEQLKVSDIDNYLRGTKG